MSDEQRRARVSITDSLQSTEVLVRQGGREFLLHFYAALRSLKLYPIENEQVQRNLDELERSAIALLELEDELEVRVTGEFIFVNSTRLRLGLDNFASFSHILTTLRQCGVGSLLVDAAVTRKEWQVLLSLLLSFSARDWTPNKLAELRQKMLQGGVTNLGVEPPLEDEEIEDEEKAKEVAKRTYEQTVAVTKEVVNSVRMGRSASVKKVKRAVQGIVDQVLASVESDR